MGLEHISGLIGVVLKVREAVQQALTTFMDEEFGFDALIGIAEQALNFGPTLSAVHVSGSNAAEAGELRSERGAVVLTGEEIAPGDSPEKAPLGEDRAPLLVFIP